jgi:hypothetical protein
LINYEEVAAYRQPVERQIPTPTVGHTKRKETIGCSQAAAPTAVPATTGDRRG